MRSTVRSLLVLAACFGATAPGFAGAEDRAPVAEPAGSDDEEGEAEVVTKEPTTIDLGPLEHNAALLDELLTLSTEQTIREQKFAGAAGITGGMIMLGISAWRLFEDRPQSQYSRGLGVMFMGLGMANLTTGIYAVTRIPHEKRRLDRWQRARKDGVTRYELAHFEGELEASQEIRQGERLLVRWDGLTHAIAGVLVIAFAPIPDVAGRADRAAGYISGGLFVFVGMAAFAASFRDTPSEKAWSAYNARKMPMPGHQLSWRLTPSVSRKGAGLSLSGRF